MYGSTDVHHAPEFSISPKPKGSYYLGLVVSSTMEVTEVLFLRSQVDFYHVMTNVLI